MIKHTALFAAMLVAGYVAPTHAETAQVEALAPQSWVVTGFVFKNDASENDIQTVESELNHQATVLNHLKGFKNYTDHALLYTRYQAAGYTFLVGPFPSDFSYIKSFQKQNASLGLIEPIKAGEEELDINVENSVLTIRGKKETDDKRQYLYQGIAHRTFERKFNLAEHVEVTEAGLNNGLLTVNLVKEIPEAMKPKQIPIGTGNGKLIDVKQASRNAA